MLPTVRHLPLDFPEMTSGVENIDRAVTAVPAHVARMHRRACWLVVIACVVLLLAIALFCASAQGATAPISAPAPATAAPDRPSFWVEAIPFVCVGLLARTFCRWSK